MAPKALVEKHRARPGSKQPENNPVIAAMMEVLDVSMVACSRGWMNWAAREHARDFLFRQRRSAEGRGPDAVSRRQGTAL
jgi:hypothetical protein